MNMLRLIISRARGIFYQIKYPRNSPPWILGRLLSGRPFSPKIIKRLEVNQCGAQLLKSWAQLAPNAPASHSQIDGLLCVLYVLNKPQHHTTAFQGAIGVLIQRKKWRLLKSLVIKTTSTHRDLTQVFAAHPLPAGLTPTLVVLTRATADQLAKDLDMLGRPPSHPALLSFRLIQPTEMMARLNACIHMLGTHIFQDEAIAKSVS